MAESTITELTELTTTEDSDVLAVVDVSATPQTTKKITTENLVKNNPNVVDNTTHRGRTDNPHSVTKLQVGLGNCDDTSDADKPVSTATQTAIDLVSDDLTDHENDFANPHSVTKLQVGLGNCDDTSDADKPISTATQSSINWIGAVLSTHINDTTNPHSVTKLQVGLGNCDDTSDADKPVSTATQTALDQKYNASNPNGYETPAELTLRDTANRSRGNHTGTQLANTISNFAASVRSTVLTGISFASAASIVATDTVLQAFGKLQSQINKLDKGFLQYSNNATISSSGPWVTIPLPTNRESLPNGLFTKTNNSNFRTDFDGYAKINFSIIVDSADNDRSFNVRVLKNGVEIPQGLYESIACGKSGNQRRGGFAPSFLSSCSDGDLFSIQLQEADSSTVQVFSGGCIMSIESYKKD